MEEGTPQGGSASPLLANVYLHYVFDLWVQAWRRKHARGDVIVVRFADDIVVGFQDKSDAQQFWRELTERMLKFDLELHPEKTRLLEFGPFAVKNRKQRGEGRPETFNFLGFTQICGKKRSNGQFTVLRQTIRQRLQAKLNEVKVELRRRMHHPIPEVGQWLRSVVAGHNRYYGVPMNDHALHLFRLQVGRLWHRALFVVARPAVSLGIGCIDSSSAGCLPFASTILILSAAWALSPKVRAGCGKAACPDPWRGL